MPFAITLALALVGQVSSDLSCPLLPSPEDMPNQYYLINEHCYKFREGYSQVCC